MLRPPAWVPLEGIGEYENSVRMTYVPGPEGIIVSLFEQLD